MTARAEPPAGLLTTPGRSRYASAADGFTLIELMIVIVIIGLLAVIAIPRFSGMASRTKQAEADMLLKQLYTLQEAYNDRYHGYAGTMDDLALVGWAPPGLSHFARPDIISGGGPGSSTYTACMTAVDPELSNRSVNQAGKMGSC